MLSAHWFNTVSHLIFDYDLIFQTSLFGEGTYLTSDLSMAILYSPHGNGWRESVLGPLISCVALCEIIDHPDVKCQVKKKGNVSDEQLNIFLFKSLGLIVLWF